MVYLDAAYDHASDQELFDRVRSQFSLSPIKLDDPYLSAIIAGSNQFHPDYDNVTAPAQSFHVIYDAPPAYARRIGRSIAMPLAEDKWSDSATK